MGESTPTSEEVTPLKIHVAELRQKERQHREDLQIVGKALEQLEHEVRRVGTHVIMLWWGFLLLFVLIAVDFISKGGKP